MKLSDKVRKILSFHPSENSRVLENLSRILMHGRLAGTGKLLILPVDQGFEHGPAKSFAINPEGYDPLYHFDLALSADLSAYAAPLGMIEAAGIEYTNKIPTILKLNSSHSLRGSGAIADQTITASVDDAVRLGCVAVGVTIYPGSDKDIEMIEEAREIIKEAKSKGLVSVVWSYPRGGILSKEGETALDTIAYGAHIAALIGTHIIKVKPPTAHICSEENKKIYSAMGVSFDKLENRVKHIVDCCFAGRRLVVFSGGVNKGVDDIIAEADAIKKGGGTGSIIGRNSFQRPQNDAIQMLNKIIDIYIQ